MTRPHLHIRILLATCNGADHLAEQLTSYESQSHPDWSLDVSDDGSRDGTQGLVMRFARASPTRAIRLADGPRNGSAANFLTLLQRGVEAAPGAAMAFSDQDDVWLPGKLSRAADWLAAHGAQEGEVLAWVCRTVLTGTRLEPRGESRVFPRPPAFGNALVQNILPGNTIVLSPAAARALAATVPAALRAGVPYHDWWVYQVVTGIGGRVGVEPEPLVLYRQHGGNHLGHHDPVRGRLRRLGLVARRRYGGWIDANLAALTAHRAMLTPTNRDLLDAFAQARSGGGRSLARALPDLGLHRQTVQGDRLLRLLALTGRI